MVIIPKQKLNSFVKSLYVEVKFLITWFQIYCGDQKKKWCHCPNIYWPGYWCRTTGRKLSLFVSFLLLMWSIGISSTVMTITPTWLPWRTLLKNLNISSLICWWWVDCKWWTISPSSQVKGKRWKYLIYIIYIILNICKIFDFLKACEESIFKTWQVKRLQSKQK